MYWITFFLFFAVWLCDATLNPIHLSSCGCWTSSQRSSIVSRLKSTLDGFSVQDSIFRFFDTAECESIGSCFFQNPSSPYGLVVLNPQDLPETPQGGAPLFKGNGEIGDWRLGLNEAALWFGCTPPTSQYYAWTSYVGSTVEYGTRYDVFGALGDSIHHLNSVFIDQCDSNGPFSRNAAWVFSPDQSIVAAIQEGLTDILGADTLVQVNVLPFPADSDWNLKIGNETDDDIFLVLLRAAIPDSIPEWDKYVSTSPISAIKVSRLDSNTDLPSLYPEFPVIPRFGTNNEWHLAGALDFLLSRVLASFPPLTQFQTRPIVGALSTRGIDYGKQCYARLENCQGDNRDALYTKISDTFTLKNRSGLVYVGIDDQAVGMALYSSLTIYDYAGQVGILSITNFDYAGSAKLWLSGTIYEHLADKLFVYSLAYQCNEACSTPPDSSAGLSSLLFRAPYCTTIPTSKYPSLAPGRVGNTLGRAYINPETFVGPSQFGVILPMQILVNNINSL